MTPRWVWVKVKPPPIGTQVSVSFSIYQGAQVPFWGYPILTPTAHTHRKPGPLEGKSIGNRWGRPKSDALLLYVSTVSECPYLNIEHESAMP